MVDDEYAYDVVKKISFPRLCGSEGERKAREILAAELTEMGVDYTEEPVGWSTAAWNLVLPLLVVTALGSAVITLVLALVNPTWTFLGLLLLLAFVGVFGWLLFSGRGHEIGMASNPKSVNFIVRIPPAGAGPGARLVAFSSHWDSKSQSVPSLWRVIFILLAGFGLVGFFTCALIVQVAALVGTAGAATLRGAQWALIVVFGVLAAGGIGTGSVRTGNLSPGALDNASGVAVCLGLARHFHAHPLDNLEVQVCVFTGEELGLYGAKAYVREHLEELRQKQAVNLNYDGVALPLRYLAKLGSVTMSSPEHATYFDTLLRAGEDAGVELQALTIPFGVWTDSIPFVKEEISSTTILGLLGASFVHRRGDSVEKVQPEALGQGIDLGIAFAERVAGSIAPKDREELREEAQAQEDAGRGRMVS